MFLSIHQPIHPFMISSSICPSNPLSFYPSLPSSFPFSLTSIHPSISFLQPSIRSSINSHNSYIHHLSIIHPSIHPSIHPFVHSSIHPSIHSIFTSIHPFVHSSIHSFINVNCRWKFVNQMEVCLLMF